MEVLALYFRIAGQSGDQHTDFWRQRIHNLNTGAVSLSNGSVSDTGNVLTVSETLKAGPVSSTSSDNGNNSVTFNVVI